MILSNLKGENKMKKILTVVLVAFVLCLSAVSAYADGNSFVSSPSGALAPELIEASNAHEECEAVVAVCSYANRDQLPSEIREKLEAAYASIAAAENPGALCDDVTTLAAELNITVDKLAVKDLFDVYYTDCETHDGHLSFTIKLGFKDIENYAGLLHYTENGWELVESELNANGELTFEVDSLSPFAVLVHDGTATQPLDWRFALAAGGAAVLVIIGYFVYRYLKDEYYF